MANFARVYIDGYIVPPDYCGPDPIFTRLSDVRVALAAQGAFDEIFVNIHSGGGSVFDGLGIYDLLRSYGKKVTTYVNNLCASIASVIFLAGDERYISANSSFMIHLPAFPEGSIGGNEIQLEAYANQLKRYTSQFVSLYAKTTKLSKDSIRQMLVNETWLTPQQCVKEGFATAIQKPMTARATIENTQLPEKQPLKASMKTWLEKMQAALLGAKAELDGATIQAKDITLNDGSTLRIDSTGDNIAVGDMVWLSEGVPAPDGEYTDTDGFVYTVLDGRVADLKTTTAEEASTETADPVASTEGAQEETVQVPKAEYEQLKAQVATITNVTKRLTTMEALLGQRESSDVPTKPAGGALPVPQARGKVSQNASEALAEVLKAERESQNGKK